MLLEHIQTQNEVFIVQKVLLLVVVIIAVQHFYQYVYIYRDYLKTFSYIDFFIVSLGTKMCREKELKEIIICLA